MADARKIIAMKTLDEPKSSDSLNQLLTRAYDAEQGFSLAAEQAESDDLKSWFQSNSEQRKSFGKQLKSHLADLDVEPDKGASVSGKIHQAFMKLRSAVSNENDLALIAECQRGEEKALNDYRAILEDCDLRADARRTLEEQLETTSSQLKTLASIEKIIEGATN